MSDSRFGPARSYSQLPMKFHPTSVKKTNVLRTCNRKKHVQNLVNDANRMKTLKIIPEIA